ncbi:chloride channel protein [Pandoraea faecigallinarum]|uniref:Chloride channel protein n=1 Tax=Pandoraea faecigallinarum TaxID=656179 RepID=A0A0H3WXJ8_9BURK|nr:chloride channel protein [Pandoraea faecigallinarum]AKM31368.1 chloride channel protein [Pandoraea faecigallinarum]
MALPEHARDFARAPGLPRVIALAAIIGLCGVPAAWLLLNLIQGFTNLFFYQTLSFAPRPTAQNTLGVAVIALPVVGGLIVGAMARLGSDKIRGHGIPEAIEAILFGKSKMSPRVAVLKPLSSGIVIGSGGPFGAEGPIIMTGGAIGSLIAQYFHLSAAERKTLLVAGATAGMTAVFGTPVAAVLLAVELLLFEWRPRSLLPVIVACAVAGFARPLLLEAGPLFPMTTPAVSPIALISCLIAGVCAGLLSAGMSRALYAIEDTFHKLPVHWMWWPAIGGLAVGIGGYLEPRALGVGYDVIADLLAGHFTMHAALALLLVKALIWAIALGSCTSGGVLAPLLMIGAGLGTLLAPMLPGGDITLWALVCMAATLAGVLGAPLTAIVFALGLTHDVNALLPLLLTCGVSYGVAIRIMPRSIMTEKIARRGRHIHREYGVDPLERLHVGELMTREPESLGGDLSIEQAARQAFGMGQRHRAYPVVDASHAVLGIVDRQALTRAREQGLQTLRQLYGVNPPLVALPSETGRIVSARFAAHHLERLPVVSDATSRKLVGIISRSDLVKPAEHWRSEEEVRERMLHLGRRRR